MAVLDFLRPRLSPLRSGRSSGDMNAPAAAAAVTVAYRDHNGKRSREIFGACLGRIFRRHHHQGAVPGPGFSSVCIPAHDPSHNYGRSGLTKATGGMSWKEKKIIDFVIASSKAVTSASAGAGCVGFQDMGKVFGRRVNVRSMGRASGAEGVLTSGWLAHSVAASLRRVRWAVWAMVRSLMVERYLRRPGWSVRSLRLCRACAASLHFTNTTATSRCRGCTVLVKTDRHGVKRRSAVSGGQGSVWVVGGSRYPSYPIPLSGRWRELGVNGRHFGGTASRSACVTFNTLHGTRIATFSFALSLAAKFMLLKV
ncbi:hypothetical protein IWX46DRAFT_630380 [Phyllosticta citricarpa]|uniref:Uncharacterized protein n=1 Tax=Phyllosticta citricarpa TaxID=55181 RepID=A0ABR1LBZ1_9PEZI